MAIATARDFSFMRFDESKKNPQGGYTVPMKQAAGGYFKTQLPQMRITNVFCDATKPNQRAVNFSLKGYETNERLQSFMQFVQDFNNFSIDAAVTHWQKWFEQKSTPPRDILAYLFRSSVQEPAAGKEQYGWQFSAKAYIEGTQHLIIEDTNGVELEDMSVDELKGCSGIPVVQWSRLWFVDGKFGASPILTRFRIKEGGSGDKTRDDGINESSDAMQM
jgi:hypothetical protein